MSKDEGKRFIRFNTSQKHVRASMCFCEAGQNEVTISNYGIGYFILFRVCVLLFV